MGNGALAKGPKLPRPSSTLPRMLGEKRGRVGLAALAALRCGDAGNVLGVEGRALRGVGRIDHGPLVVIAPVMAASMAA